MSNPNLQLRIKPELHAAITRDPAWKCAVERLLSAVYLTEEPLVPVRRRGRPKTPDPKTPTGLRLRKSIIEMLAEIGKPNEEIAKAVLEHLAANYPGRQRSVRDTMRDVMKDGGGRIKI